MKFLFASTLALLSSNVLAQGNRPVDTPTAAAASPTAAAEEPVEVAAVDASTDSVTAEFMGNSGGMRLVTNDGESYIKVQQDRLVEVGANGKQCAGCFKMNVAGKNEWSALETTDVEGGKAYSTTFTVLDGGDVDFSLTAHLTSVTTTVTDIVPCSGCHKNETKTTDMPGVCWRQNCKDPSDEQGNCPKQCVDLDETAPAACPQDYEMCGEEVSITASELKFSFILGGVAFQDPANKLTYGLSLKTNDDGDVVIDDAGEETAFNVGGASVSTPTFAIVKGWEKEDRQVDVSVTLEDKGGKRVILFEFPAIADDEVLYYDPTLALALSQNSASTLGMSLAGLLAVGAAILY
jgi:hypothetical protein